MMIFSVHFPLNNIVAKFYSMNVSVVLQGFWNNTLWDYCCITYNKIQLTFYDMLPVFICPGNPYLLFIYKNTSYTTYRNVTLKIILRSWTANCHIGNKTHASNMGILFCSLKITSFLRWDMAFYFVSCKIKDILSNTNIYWGGGVNTHTLNRFVGITRFWTSHLCCDYQPYH